MADSRDLPQAAVDDIPALFNDFWALIMGVNTEIKWLNHSGVPVRSGAYVSEPITPTREQPSADGPATRAGIVLHSYFSL
ncbi:hypothetical protein [Streptomyces djakartensis]|nr:hypothetical protein [Streptomyces djakartensis]